LRELKLVVTKRDAILGATHPDSILAANSLAWIKAREKNQNESTLLWREMPNPNSLRLAVR